MKTWSYVLYALMVAYPAAVYAAGSSFSPNETWTLGPYFGSRGRFFADVTEERKADAIVDNDDRVTVRRSEGPFGSRGILENPLPGSFQSGLGLIAGWVCAANRIDIEVDGGTSV